MTDTARLHGAEHSLTELVAGLVDRYRIDVVAPSDGPLLQRLQQAGVSTHTVPMSRWLVEGRRPRFGRSRCVFTTLRSAVALMRLFRANATALVVVNTMASPAGAIAARLSGRPVVWFGREFIGPHYNRRFMFGERASLWTVKRLSHRVFAVSRAVAAWLHAGGLPDARVVYAGCEPAGTLAPPSSAHKVVLAMVGRPHLTKGHDIAVRALAKLRQRGIEAELLCVGGSGARFVAEFGTLASTLEVADALTVIPDQPAPWSVVPADAIVLVPSRHEAFGRVTIEAMKLGLPVIGALAIQELIEDGYTGLLFRNDDASQLATCIETLLRNPDLRRTVAENGRRFALGTFSRSRYAADFVAGIEDLLPQSDARSASSLPIR